MMEFTLKSSAFEDGKTIPKEYTCDGLNVSPPLTISGVPESSKSLVLIVDDSDIPEAVKKARLIEKFDHWILFNIPADTTTIEKDGTAGVAGSNSYGDAKYAGPCPPIEHEPTEHRYVFQIYALDTELTLNEGIIDSELRSAMKGHITEKAELVGLCDRTKT